MRNFTAETQREERQGESATVRRDDSLDKFLFVWLSGSPIVRFSLRTLRLCGLLFFLFTFCPIITQAQTPPDFPPLTFDSFEPKIRNQLRQAYTEAQAKPQNAVASGALGMALHAYKQYEYAAFCYQRAIHFAPQEMRWHYFLGLVQSALARHTEAITAFKSALQIAPNDLPLQLRYADTLLAAGQYREAMPIYELLSKQPSFAALAQFGIGQSKIALGDKMAGIAALQQAIALLPEFGAAHYSLGLALRTQGQKEAAQKHLALSQQFKFQRPQFADPLLELVANLNASATDQLSRGVVFANAGQLEQSIAAHERALELNAQLVQAHINLISLYAQMGKLPQAEQHYQAALTVNPNLADSHFNYGIILMQQERYGEAAEAFKRAFERNPYSAEAHYNYGTIIERDGKLEEAAAHFQLAIENNPNHRMARFSLGRIYVNQNKLPAALEQFRQTLTPEDEETPRLLYALGATYIRAGDRPAGIPYLRAAVKKAQAFGQAELAAAIERDLRLLGQSQ